MRIKFSKKCTNLLSSVRYRFHFAVMKVSMKGKKIASKILKEDISKDVTILQR